MQRTTQARGLRSAAALAIASLASVAQADVVPIVNPGFETVSRPLAGGEQTNGIGGRDVLLGTRFPFPFGPGVVDWTDPVVVPGWQTFTVPFGSPNEVLAGALRPTTVDGEPFVTGIEGEYVVAVQAALVGQRTTALLQPDTVYTLSFLGGISQVDSEYFFSVSLTAIDASRPVPMPVEGEPGVTRLELGSFFPPSPEPDGIMRRYTFSYTSPPVLPPDLVGTHVGINIFGSDGLPRVIYDDFALTAVALAPLCPADLDGSGVVEFADLLAVLAAFGISDAGDVNGDGATDFGDVLAVLGGWGVCP